MTRSLSGWLTLLLLAATQQSANSNPPAPGEKPVSPLRPGMAWRVETLPESMRTKIGRQPNESRRNPEGDGRDSSQIFLEEENEMGVNFRKQTMQIARGRFLTRLVQGNVYFFPEEIDGDEHFSIEFAHGEMAFGLVDSKRLVEFEWVDPKWWVGNGVVDGEECHLFRAPWPPGSSAGAKPPAAEERALFAAVGIKDRFPRRLETPYFVRRYSVLPRLSPPPSLPAGAAKALKELEEEIERETKRYRISQ